MRDMKYWLLVQFGGILFAIAGFVLVDGVEYSMKGLLDYNLWVGYILFLLSGFYFVYGGLQVNKLNKTEVNK